MLGFHLITLSGALKVSMDGREFVVPAGSLLHIPAAMVHSAVATDDGDAVYLVWRDRVNDKAGKPVTIEVESARARSEG